MTATDLHLIVSMMWVLVPGILLKANCLVSSARAGGRTNTGRHQLRINRVPTRWGRTIRDGSATTGQERTREAGIARRPHLSRRALGSGVQPAGMRATVLRGDKVQPSLRQDLHICSASPRSSAKGAR